MNTGTPHTWVRDPTYMKGSKSQREIEVCKTF